MVTVSDSPPELGTERPALQPSSPGPVSKHQAGKVSDTPAKALWHTALGASGAPPAHSGTEAPSTGWTDVIQT